MEPRSPVARAPVRSPPTSPRGATAQPVAKRARASPDECPTARANHASPGSDGSQSPGEGTSAEAAMAAAESANTLRLLQALTAGGRSVEDAVSEALSHLPRLRDPVLAALRASPDLRTDLPALAELVEALGDCVAGDGRQRLSLGLRGIADVARLIAGSRNIVVLSGAGVSVSCGIPDFRSKGGLYETVLERFGLKDPQAIFDLMEFKMDPTLFYAFAKDVMPPKDLRPSPTHRFVAELARRGKLRRNYSQNIDGLEARAGIPADRLVLCHGSFLTATCMRPSCRAQVPGEDIAPTVARGEVPLCAVCNAPGTPPPHAPGGSDSDDDSAGELDHACARGVLKPDITFFGEYLPERVNDCLNADLHKADLLLVLGTSLQVAPVARIPHFFPAHFPRILVNRELVDYRFDVELLGNCDAVVARLRSELGWDRPPGAAPAPPPQTQNPAADPCPGTDTPAGSTDDSQDPERCEFVPPRRFLFTGTKIQADDSPDDNVGSTLVDLLNRFDESGSSSDDMAECRQHEHALVKNEDGTRASE